MNDITVGYITNRTEPKLEWFLDSLDSQTPEKDLSVIVVDFHADKPERREHLQRINAGRFNLLHVTPKPTVWQGPYRLTKADYFAASNATNTAIALCRTPWLAMADDVSVFRPGWWERVKMARRWNGITCGAYRKVFRLEVNAGAIASYEDSPGGHDHRIKLSQPRGQPCTGQWFYGCSFVARVEDLLKINGFDEDCDGAGYQDTIAGMMLTAQGVRFWYDPTMIALESEELHSQPGNYFMRWDPGKSPDDKSHAMLKRLNEGRKVSPNYFGPDGLRGVRERVLKGEPFPTSNGPQHEWFTGVPLSELGDPPPKWP